MKLLPVSRKGNIVEKGIALVIFFFLLVFLPTIFAMVNQEMKFTVESTYGNASQPSVIADNGMNASVRFSRQIPTAATIGGMTIVILMIGFAIGDYLAKRNDNSGGGTPPAFTGGGFGG